MRNAQEETCYRVIKATTTTERIQISNVYLLSPSDRDLSDRSEPFHPGLICVRYAMLTLISEAHTRPHEPFSFSFAESLCCFRTPRKSSNRSVSAQEKSQAVTLQRTIYKLSDRSCQGVSPLASHALCDIGSFAQTAIPRYMDSWWFFVPASECPATANDGNTDRVALAS